MQIKSITVSKLFAIALCLSVLPSCATLPANESGGLQAANKSNASADAVASLILGKKLYRNNEYAAAERELLKSVAVDQTIADGHVLLGNIYFKWDRFDDGLKYFQQALEIEPNNLVAANNLSLLNLRETNRALQTLEKILPFDDAQKFRVRNLQDAIGQYLAPPEPLVNKVSLEKTEVLAPETQVSDKNVADQEREVDKEPLKKIVAVKPEPVSDNAENGKSVAKKTLKNNPVKKQELKIKVREKTEGIAASEADSGGKQVLQQKLVIKKVKLKNAELEREQLQKELRQKEWRLKQAKDAATLSEQG